MADAPDPLGKRALFWAPAQRQEAGPRRPEKRVPPGRHALFSAAGAAPDTETPKKNGRPRPHVSVPPRPDRRTRAPRPPAVRPPPGPTPTKVADRPAGRPISLSCSKCGTHTDVDILKYVVLHMPWWFWRPGRGYTSLMKCPACGKRAWLSASWSPWHR